MKRQKKHVKRQKNVKRQKARRNTKKHVKRRKKSKRPKKRVKIQRMKTPKLTWEKANKKPEKISKRQNI